MLKKLEAIEQRHQEIGKQLAEPGITGDMKKYAQLSKTYKDLEKIVQVANKYKNILSNIDNNKQIINQEKDEEFRQLAKQDLEQLQQEKEKVENHIRQLLVPKDPNDSKKCHTGNKSRYRGR